jgi:hypothetical protein
MHFPVNYDAQVSNKQEGTIQNQSKPLKLKAKDGKELIFANGLSSSIAIPNRPIFR